MKFIPHPPSHDKPAPDSRRLDDDGLVARRCRLIMNRIGACPKEFASVFGVEHIRLTMLKATP